MGLEVPEVKLRPSLVAVTFLREEEIQARLEELVGKSGALVIPSPGQPTMQPGPGAVDPVSRTPSFCFLVSILFSICRALTSTPFMP